MTLVRLIDNMILKGKKNLGYNVMHFRIYFNKIMFKADIGIVT